MAQYDADKMREAQEQNRLLREEKTARQVARVKKLFEEDAEATDASIARTMGLGVRTVTRIRREVLKLPARPKGTGALLNLSKASGKWAKGKPKAKKGGAR